MTNKQQASIYIGTSGWTYKGWGEKFYPKEIKTKNWFSYYATKFNTVEINATFYRLFSEETFIKWKINAPAGFLYMIKVPRVITHRKKLINCKREIKKFCQLTMLLQDKLGLMLMQLPPSIAYDLPRLKKALLQFDQPQKVVVEFRHPKWLTDETYTLLKEIGCIFCDTDSPVMKLMSWVTSDIAYIRLHGTTRWFDYQYTLSQLKQIKAHTEKMLAQGVRSVFILFNNDVHAYAPKNAIQLLKLFNQ